MIKSFSLLAFVFLNTIICAQDPVFNQTDNSQVYQNPAYIGTNKSFSADFQYRNQWPELSGNFKTMAVQVNQYLGKGNGVSMHFVNDLAGNLINKTNVGLGYGKTFVIAKTHFVSLGAQVSYFHNQLDYDKLTFGDMIDPRSGYDYISNEPLIIEPDPIGLDFNSGILYYNKYFFVGYAAKHLTQPNESFFGQVSRLPLRHGIELGGKIKWGKVDFIPTFRWYNQDTFNTTFAALKVKIKKLEINSGIQFENGIFGGLGFNSEHFNISYNYTHSINGISKNISTHEIRCGIDFQTFKKENEHYFDF